VSFRVRELVFRRPGFTLQIPSLDIEECRMTAIVGPNGAGKTTMLKCLAGLLPVPPGSVLLGDQDLSSLGPGECSRRLTFVPQEHTSAFNYRVRDFVLMGRAPYLGVFSVPSQRDVEKAAEALDFVGLSGYANRPFHQMSSGERRLILIARALAQSTDILIMDEPTTFLDPRHETEVMALLSRLVAEHGKTVLVTLHNLDMAVRYAARLIFIKAGVLVAQGRPEIILDEGLLQDVYEIPMNIIRYGGRTFIVK